MSPKVIETCPCCGQRFTADIPMQISMEFNTLILGERAIKLHPKQIEILHVLKEAWPRKLKKEQLITRVWGSFSDASDGTVRTTIFKTNQRIRAFGYVIRFGGDKSSGYRLEKIGQFK